jgi:WD40 repeat protein
MADSDPKYSESDEMAALADAYSRKYDDRGRSRAAPAPRPTFGRGGARSSGPPSGHLATSHEENEAYMDEMHRAYGLGEREPIRGMVVPGGPLGPSRTRPSGVAAPRLSNSWEAGPVDPRGLAVDLSHRPVLCSALDPERGRVAFGCSDHAVYELSLSSGAVTRTLFTKRYGHVEWVTAVTYLEDGTLASAAMDAKICLWSPSAVRCTDLHGHSGSISALAPLGLSVVSAGYDHTVRVWDSRGGSQTALLEGHRGPVLCLALDGSTRGVSGGRDSLACAWDFETGSRIGRMAGHKGHVTAASWLQAGEGSDGNLFATGAQDGHVRVWDLRARKAVANTPVHTTQEGAGAVGDLGVCTATSPFDVVSAGADQAVCVLDSRKGFTLRSRLEHHHDFIYALCVAGRIALSGSGDGILLAHDVVRGEPLWALGANEAAVRCIECAGSTIVASGDDGKAMVYRA